MRKLALLLGITFCLTSANDLQEMVCGNESLLKCINHYDKQCDDKNYVACNIVGDLEETRENYSRAKKYYEMACEKANNKAIYKINRIDDLVVEVSGITAISTSCSPLGTYYRDGKGVRQDFNKAMQYYKKSCDADGGYACMEIGFLYYDGKGIQKDLKRAIKLWTKSCELKSAIGCHTLGVIYHNGEGVKQNFSKAKELYGKACDLGQQLGCDDYKKLNEMNIK